MYGTNASNRFSAGWDKNKARFGALSALFNDPGTAPVTGATGTPGMAGTVDPALAADMQVELQNEERARNRAKALQQLWGV